MSVTVTMYELYIISDYVQNLYLAKVDLLANQNSFANKPVDVTSSLSSKTTLS